MATMQTIACILNNYNAQELVKYYMLPRERETTTTPPSHTSVYNSNYTKKSLRKGNIEKDKDTRGMEAQNEI